MSNNGHEEAFDLSQLKRGLNDFIVHHRKGRALFAEAVKTCSTIKEIKEVLMLFSNTYFRETEVLMYVTRTQFDHIENIGKAIDALPRKSEFDDVRKEMDSFRTKMRETSRALKDIIDESKKRSN
ncbi:MAG: hypothetical protein ACRD5B_19230, partial [Nitrososphaeraceae archaeon]